jgi:uncharacterized protein YqgC (DUF456 family)
LPGWLPDFIFAITLVLMLVGLAGLILPIFPGIIVIWLAALGYGVVTGFTTLGWVIFAVLTILMIAGATIDNVLINARAHKEGASCLTLIIGMIAGIVGTILFPPFGGLIAAPLVVWLIEYLRLRDLDRAFASLRGMAIGFGASYVVRLMLGLAMIGLWLVWVINR